MVVLRTDWPGLNVSPIVVFGVLDGDLVVPLACIRIFSLSSNTNSL